MPETKFTVYRLQQSDVSEPSRDIFFLGKCRKQATEFRAILPQWRVTQLRCFLAPNWRFTQIGCYRAPSWRSPAVILGAYIEQSYVSTTSGVGILLKICRIAFTWNLSSVRNILISTAQKQYGAKVTWYFAFGIQSFDFRQIVDSFLSNFQWRSLSVLNLLFHNFKVPAVHLAAL